MTEFDCYDWKAWYDRMPGPDAEGAELHATVPEFGDGRFLPTPVKWQGRVEDGIKHVRIQGAASATIEVTEAS